MALDAGKREGEGAEDTDSWSGQCGEDNDLEVRSNARLVLF